MVYLFIGEDSLSKDTQLKKIKQQFLTKNTQEFNLDVLYGKELTLKEFQEKLEYLPLKSTRRIVVVKNAQELRQDVREYLTRYVRNPHSHTLLVLDITKRQEKDALVVLLQRYCKIFRFKEALKNDTFTLSRTITHKKADQALKILYQLLKDGERPERILGGLRYAWEKEVSSAQEMRKKLMFLLECDIDIKTGRLKPGFALEKLVVRLCGLGEPFH